MAGGKKIKHARIHFRRKTPFGECPSPTNQDLNLLCLNELPTRANAVAVASGVVAITMFAAPLYCFLVIVHSDSYHKEYRYQHAYDQASNSNFHSPILASI